MERIRAVHESQKSITGASGTPSSPLASPVHRHSRSGSAAAGSLRRPQNNAAKAAAQRLAQVMSYQDDDDEDGTDEFNYDISSTGIGLAGGRTRGSRSPMKISTAKMAISKNPVEQPRYTDSSSTAGRLSQSTEHPSLRSVSSGRPAHAELSSSERPTSAGRQAKISNSTEQPSSLRSTSISGLRQAQPSSTYEQPSSARATSGARQAQATSTMEQPSSARYSISTRPSQVASNAMDHQPLSARASGRSIAGAKAAPKLPTAVPLTLRQSPSMASADENKKDKRLSIDLGSMNFRDKEIPSQRSATALEDEVDMLQEENEVLLEKLHLAEVRCEEAEERARQLEQQVANLGEGVGSDACELSSKEAALQEREAALRAAAQTYGISSQEVAALRTEAEIARNEATSAVELLQESENELNSLRLLNRRVMLTKEEIEELVMKRCWLARYWGLCVKHGIHAEIAEARHEFWSSFISSPVDVVLAAGQKAKEEKEEANRILNEHYEEGNIEDMLIVEKGLGELTSLKVENAVAIAMARNRRRNALKSGLSGADELKLPTELSADAFELSQEESEDVLFKQAWLTYFWTRAKSHGLEAEIADERLQYWINRNITSSPSSHDAVEVERGLKELIKLDIETQLWEASRRLFEEENSMS